MRRLSILTFFLMLLTAAGTTFAEVGKGSISGTIKTTDGLPAAFISIQLDAGERSAQSAEDGSFIFRSVSTGEHELSILVSGFQPFRETVSVEENGTTTVEVTLVSSLKTLEEVTVRGGSNYKATVPSSSLRLQEPLQEIPQNIQIVTGKVMSDQQVTSMSDGLIRNVSGATRLEHWGDMYTRVNMRGDRAAAFRNGMNITSPWGPLTEDMSFVDHVEFVKGPAGFMMSNGEPSGIYNVVTKKPTGATRGEVGLMLGSYDFYRGTMDLEGKLDKEGKLLYRVNLMGQTKNSFRPYEYNNRYSIAPVISYKVDEKTTLTLEYVLQHAKMSNVGSYYAFATNDYATLPANYTALEPGLEPTRINDHNVTLNLQHAFNSNWKLTAQLSYFNYQQVGSSMWPGYVDSSGNMIRNVSIWDASNISKFGQVYLNGNIQTGAVQHRILGGLDLGDKQYLADWNQGFDLDSAGAYFNTKNPVYGSPVNGYPEFDRSKPLNERAGIYGTLSQRYTGLYLQDELGFLKNKIRLTLAGRYTYVEDNSYGTISDGSRFTPRVGVSVSIDRETSVYALYDQTFVPQTGIRRDGKSVLPITGNNIEAGLKKDWFEGKWNTTASVYRILKNNQNATDPANTPGEQYVVQFGQTQTQGFELDIRGQILPGLSLIANYAYTDSKITEADSSEAAQKTIGDKVPGYATHNANLWLNYRVRGGMFKGLGVNAGGGFQGDRTTWSWGGPGDKNLPDYVRLDAGLTYEHGKFVVTANVFNLLNDYLYAGSYYAYGGFYYWQAEAGRNLRVGVNYRF